MSPSLLSRRLKELEDAGVVERRPSSAGSGFEYHLTEAGEALGPLIEGLGVWGHKYVQRKPRREELDPSLLMWDVRRWVDPSQLPSDARTVVQFDLDGVPLKKSRWWLVFDRGEADLCLRNPGYDVDLRVSSHIRALVDVWLGHRTLREAQARDEITLDGTRALVRGFKRWFLLSPFAHLSHGRAPSTMEPARGRVR